MQKIGAWLLQYLSYGDIINYVYVLMERNGDFMDHFYLYEHIPKLGERKAFAEIDTDALIHNYNTLCGIIRGVKHICVVKADAYGHTCEICVPELLMAGCDFFAVACIEEAIMVKKICDKHKMHADILILGYTLPSQAKLLADGGFIQTLLSPRYADELACEARKQNCRVRAHIALDTGMNRIGFRAESLAECTAAVSEILDTLALEGISLEGMFTHFAKADEDHQSVVDSPDSYTRHQAEMFICVKRALEDRGIRLFCHACNSAASVRFPEYAFDGVRLGILLYGVQPSNNFDVDVRPVMSLKTVIAHINELSPGQAVGYNGTYISDRERRIATLPIGYADGLLRAYSGCEVTVKTKNGMVKASIIGRICMDQCMIDVTDTDADIGDAVTVFGTSQTELRALAAKASTIEYESICQISSRIARTVKSKAII